MPNVWPPTLPQNPQLGWSEKKLDNKVRSPVDNGPSKVRRQFTNPVRRLTYPLVLTEAQVATLDTFHSTTLRDGVDRFEHVHPRTGLTHDFRIVGDLDVSEPFDGFYRVTLELEYQL